MDSNYSKQLNRTEKSTNQLMVFLIFGITTMLCCVLIALVTTDINVVTRKQQAIYNMQRVKDFRKVQDKEMHRIDSLFTMITNFNPGVYAQYEETEIKISVNDLKKIYEEKIRDKRFQVFQHASDLCNIWFNDKKKLWAINQNVKKFQQDLDDCEIGLQKMKDKLDSK